MATSPAIAAEVINPPIAASERPPVKKRTDFNTSFSNLFEAITKAKENGVIRRKKEDWEKALDAVQDGTKRAELSGSMTEADVKNQQDVQKQIDFENAFTKREKELAEIAQSENKDSKFETVADTNTGQFKMKLEVIRMEDGKPVEYAEGNASETYRGQIWAAKKAVAEEHNRLNNI